MTETVTDIAELELPFRRSASLKNAEFENGLNFLRLTLREGRRFTVIDLDPDSAQKLGGIMQRWASVSAPSTQNKSE